MIAVFERSVWALGVWLVVTISLAARYQELRVVSGIKEKIGETVRICTVRSFRPRWDKILRRTMIGNEDREISGE